MSDTDAPSGEPRALDRALRPFGDVRAGEGAITLLLALNVFLLLLGYYVCKTVREPLVLATGGVLGKAAAGALQAVVLMVFIPVYSWFASRVDRMRLITGVLLFFALDLELFWLAAQAGVPYLGAAFFVWVGIFNNAVVAQFWSYGNDIFDEPTGRRLFPVIAIGMTLGAPLGSKLTSFLFRSGVAAYTMLHVTAVLLVVCLLLFRLVERTIGARRARGAARETQPVDSGRNGFTLIARNGYLRLICLLLLLLNLVNTSGQYVLDSMVTARAAELSAGQPGFDTQAWMGAFYGDFYFWVNVLTFLLQAFVVSRLVRYVGVAGVLLALPVVALGFYGSAAVFTTLGVLYATKTAENATDYSVMNTARQLLWLVTSREEKYKAKQAADTFVVRSGDVLALGVYYAGTAWIGLGPRGLALTNFVVALLWLGVGLAVLREYRRLRARAEALAA